MAAIDWLIARPVAHRGLHDGIRIIENTASAFTAAIAANYGIETDLQITADGEAMVHHDDALGRLTEGEGPLARRTAAELKRVAFKATADRMMTLAELLDLVAGRTLLLIELKSRFDNDRRLVARAAEVLAGYTGPFAVMSFDPQQIADLRVAAPAITRGILAEWRYDDAEWQRLSTVQKWKLAYLVHAFRTRPQFLAFYVKDLPAPAPLLARYLFRLPVLTWTVRSEDDRRRAVRWADQMIFEGFQPRPEAATGDR